MLARAHGGKSMAKISPVSAKYIINAEIHIEGMVDRPDVIGAIFGQTEGLIGSELELRELQRSGRIGRIEVNLENKSGKSSGEIIIPSSLDKAETSIIGASLEIIQRIGPCNARVRVKSIEDVRISKRSMVVDRAKELLKSLMDSTMPDSQELADEVASAVRVMEIQTYGRERLPSGPAIDESDEVILVEGRADVLNLLRYGFKNAIGLNGTSVPETVKELSRKKTMTAFLDGDRGGDLILKELIATTDFDFVARAPDGKEVEELTKKEIHKALRAKIAVEQAKLEVPKIVQEANHRQQRSRRERPRRDRRSPPELNESEKEKFKTMVEDLIGTKAVFFVDDELNVLGKVPFSELESTLAGIGNTYALVMDETITRDIARLAKNSNVTTIVGIDKKTNPKDEDSLRVLTVGEL